jgi:hypothetical protein
MCVFSAVVASDYDCYIDALILGTAGGIWRLTAQSPSFSLSGSFSVFTNLFPVSGPYGVGEPTASSHQLICRAAPAWSTVSPASIRLGMRSGTMVRT